MTIVRRIYMSMPSDPPLSAAQNALKWGIVDEVRKLNYQPEIFLSARSMRGLAAGKAWNFERVDAVARRCCGAVVIGLPRWPGPPGHKSENFASEYNHYEGAVAYTLGLPLLVLGDETVGDRGIFLQGGGPYIVPIPRGADQNWLSSPDFTAPFLHWTEDLKKRRDIFLGYCSSSQGIANNLRRLIQSDFGATVLDWQTDFTPGRTILEEIAEAASRCSAGIFLFTKDDEFPGPNIQAAPRDNVVFEAGYFCQSKGKDRVLIIREQGAKMPADLGGDIYATLNDRSNIGPIEQQIRMFLQQRL